MVHLTLGLFVLAVTLSCGLAYVPTSNMKCECTCSPINNPSSKYLAVGNFEASMKPKTEMKTTFTTDAVTLMKNKIPQVPPELKESPFKGVNSDPTQERLNFMNNNKKESSISIIKKETAVPLVNTYSSKPAAIYSSRSTTYGFVSPTSATIIPNSPIQVKITPPSAYKTGVRQVSKNSTEPRDESLNEIIDTKRIDEISKTKALTLDDIIFGKVPFDFGSRGIQRISLTDSEIDAMKDQQDGQTTSTMNASKTTKMSTSGTTAAETAAATEFIASETTASKTAAGLEQKSTMTSVQQETSIQPETPTATMETATTTVTTTEATTTLTTTMAPTTLSSTIKTVKPNSRRGLLPLFRTAYSSFAAEKTEKPIIVTLAAGPLTETSTKSTSLQPTVKTTPTITTKKATMAPTTTPKPTTKAPTTTTTTTTPKPTTVTTQKPTQRQHSPQQSYNVHPSSPPQQNKQRKTVSIISRNQANPSYKFSDSFRKNTIRNLLDAFKPDYLKTLHEEPVTPVSRPSQTESRQQFVHPPPPPPPAPQKMQMEADIPFGHFEKTRTVDVPNHHLVHSMSSLSSMNGQQSVHSHHPSLVVLDSPAQQQVSYHLHGQDAAQPTSWNPIQEPKKWGESKLWSAQNEQFQPQQQQQQQHQSMILPNQQAWNSQTQQNSIQKSQVFNPSFAMSGQSQQQHQPQRQNPFPGLQLNKSPIDFRVH